MPKPYSSDIRKRVANSFKRNIRYEDIAKTLDVSLSTVKRYASIYKKDKDINPRIRNKFRSSKIQDLKKFEEFVIRNNHLSLNDMSKKYDDNISAEGIRKAIKKIGYSFKKNSGYIKKET